MKKRLVSFLGGFAFLTVACSVVIAGQIKIYDDRPPSVAKNLNNGFYPDIAGDTKDNIFVIFQGNEIKNINTGKSSILPCIGISKSIGGKKFSKPNSATSEESYTINCPSLAVDGSGVIHIAYYADDKIFYIKSEDQGINFSTPIFVSETKTAFQTKPSIAIFKKHIYLVWEGEKDNIFLSKSFDGKVFSKNKIVNNPKTGIDKEPRIAIGSDETLYIIWSAKKDNIYWGVFLVKSMDKGESFSRPRRIDDNEFFETRNPDIATFGKKMFM